MKKIAIMLLAVFVMACSSDSNDGPNTSNYSLYIIADVNGQTFESGIDVDAVSNADPYGASLSYQPIYNGPACVDMIYEPGLYPFGDDTLGNMGIGFVRFLSNAGITCAQELDNFDMLFPTGSYTYAMNSDSYGVNINYAPSSDGNSGYYLSYGPQDGSASFQITSIEPYDCGFSQCLFVTGTFSCTLYNEQDPTDTLEITNGIFKLSHRSWNP